RPSAASAGRRSRAARARAASSPAPRCRSPPRGRRTPRLPAGARARGAAAARRLRRGSAWRWAGASPLTDRSLARRERRPYVPAMTEVLKDVLARRFATRAVHGGTHRQMTHVWARLGLAFAFVDGADTDAIAAAVTPATRMLFAETPTNPMMGLCDLRATADIAQRTGTLLVVDNTFATPCFQRPLELGADIVLHSTTKYLNGHSDMVGGMVIVNRDDLAERIGFIQNASGAVPGPFDCWLALRGTKTLALR